MEHPRSPCNLPASRSGRMQARGRRASMDRRTAPSPSSSRAWKDGVPRSHCCPASSMGSRSSSTSGCAALMAGLPLERKLPRTACRRSRRGAAVRHSTTRPSRSGEPAPGEGGERRVARPSDPRAAPQRRALAPRGATRGSGVSPRGSRPLAVWRRQLSTSQAVRWPGSAHWSKSWRMSWTRTWACGLLEFGLQFHGRPRQAAPNCTTVVPQRLRLRRQLDRKLQGSRLLGS